MEQLFLPDSLKEIGFRAFSYCSSLKEVIIPNSVETIGSKAFYRCDSLARIIIPKGKMKHFEKMLGDLKNIIVEQRLES